MDRLVVARKQRIELSFRVQHSSRFDGTLCDRRDPEPYHPVAIEDAQHSVSDSDTGGPNVPFRNNLFVMEAWRLG